jgi:hypothetical protein
MNPRNGRRTARYGLKLITALATFATITTAAATAMSATTEGTLRAIFAGTGFVDRQFTAFVAFAMEGFNSLRSIFRSGHRDKGETAGAARHFVHDQIHCGNRAVLSEKILEISFGYLKRDIPDVEFGTHDELTSLFADLRRF